MQWYQTLQAQVLAMSDPDAADAADALVQMSGDGYSNDEMEAASAMLELARSSAPPTVPSRPYVDGQLEWNSPIRLLCTLLLRQPGNDLLTRLPNGPISVHIRQTRVCLMWIQ